MSTPATAPDMHDGSPMPWGKYKDKRMIDIPAHYFIWLHDQGCKDHRVMKYINSNLQALIKEADRAPRR